jgi:hypothetical protein
MRAVSGTEALLDVGGYEALLKMTSRFYEKMFLDPHLDQFVRNHEDPHAERLAKWMVEKFGGPANWSADIEERKKGKAAVCANGQRVLIYDRTSAHVAAWNSVKRDPEKVGRRFKLDDCRIWMRLMFWSAREEGLLEKPLFSEFFLDFIGHFVAVYERSAPPYVDDSVEWSADPANVQHYLENGRKMQLD